MDNTKGSFFIISCNNVFSVTTHSRYKGKVEKRKIKQRYLVELHNFA